MENETNDKELSELKGRLTELETQVNTNKKVWYKDTGLIISIIAVIFSIYTGLSQIHHQSAEDLKAKRDEASQVIITLLNTDLEYRSDKTLKSDSEKRYTYNDKFKILLNRVNKVESEIPNQLSFSDYEFVGQMYRKYGKDLISEEKYYQKALMQAPTWSDSMFLYTYMGNNEFAGGAVFADTTKAIKYFLNARKVVKPSTWYIRNNKIDGYAIECIVNTYSELADNLSIGPKDSKKVTKYMDSCYYYLNQIRNNNWYVEVVDDFNDEVQDINENINAHYPLAPRDSSTAN